MATSDERDERARRLTRRAPTLADVLARQLARIGLMWATRWILAGLALVIALGLLAAVGLLLIVLFSIGGLLGLTSSSGASTAFLVAALAISAVILFLPTRWAARNLLRTERSLDAKLDRLAVPTTLDPGTVVERHATTAAELAALDARLAPSASPSGAGEHRPEEPDR